MVERYGIDITVVNPKIDPTFAFMTLDHDGKIRMDCSSPYAMAGLVELKDRFDIAFGNDPDAPATPEQKNLLKKLSPEAITATELGGEPITTKLTRAPGNDASIGGLKVVSANGWFAARPSGTENIYKLYAESVKSADHLAAIVKQAQEIVSRSLVGK